MTTPPSDERIPVIRGFTCIVISNVNNGEFRIDPPQIDADTLSKYDIIVNNNIDKGYTFITEVRYDRPNDTTYSEIILKIILLPMVTCCHRSSLEKVRRRKIILMLNIYYNVRVKDKLLRTREQNHTFNSTDTVCILASLLLPETVYISGGNDGVWVIDTDKYCTREEYYKGPYNPWTKSHQDNGMAGIFQGKRIFNRNFPFTLVHNKGERLKILANSRTTNDNSIKSLYELIDDNKIKVRDESKMLHLLTNISNVEKVTGSISSLKETSLENEVKESARYLKDSAEAAANNGGLSEAKKKKLSDLTLKKQDYKEKLTKGDVRIIEYENLKNTKVPLDMKSEFGVYHLKTPNIKTIFDGSEFAIPSNTKYSDSKSGYFISVISMPLNAYTSTPLTDEEFIQYHSACNIISNFADVFKMGTPNRDLIHGFDKLEYTYPLYFEKVIDHTSH